MPYRKFRDRQMSFWENSSSRKIHFFLTWTKTMYILKSEIDRNTFTCPANVDQHILRKGHLS